MAFFANIDEFLTDHEKVPCLFLQDVDGVGYLDGRSSSESISKDKRVELPLWLATFLVTQKNPFIQVLLPKFFHPNVQHDLKVSPIHTKVSDLNPHFFRCGIRVSNLIQDMPVQSVLRKCFQQRIEHLAAIMGDHSVVEYGDYANVDFLRHLDGMEQEMHQIGAEAVRTTKAWRDRKREPLGMSPVLKTIVTRRQRKLLETTSKQQQ